MPPHVLYGLHDPPSWAWQECNRLLRLGRPWGAVTLSRWCVSGDRGGCSARRGLKPKVYQSTQTMVTAGIFPFKENSHGRARNRIRDLMISSQRLWPLDHEAGQRVKCKTCNSPTHTHKHSSTRRQTSTWIFHRFGSGHSHTTDCPSEIQ